MRIRLLSLGLHILIMLAVAVLAVVILFFWLDHYTRHGDVAEVPDVCGLYYLDADIALSEGGMRSTVIDSMYIDGMEKGIVLDQVPRAGSAVKHGRTIYLTINALSPRKIAVPELRNLSYRQAEAIVKGLGLSAPQIIYWNSEYKDLVLNVMADGRPVEAGDRLPVTARITFSVGNGVYAPTRKVVASKDSLAADSLMVDSLSLDTSVLPDF